MTEPTARANGLRGAADGIHVESAQCEQCKTSLGRYQGFETGRGDILCTACYARRFGLRPDPNLAAFQHAIYPPAGEAGARSGR